MSVDNEIVEVTQADREAAWPFRSGSFYTSDRDAWMAGRYDHIGQIQALARHRLATEQAGWRDINSAPYNKTHVALLRVHADGSWTYGHGYYMPLDGWRCWKCEPYGPPTHWFPIPDGRLAATLTNGGGEAMLAARTQETKA